jgi:hypothetical protein
MKNKFKLNNGSNCWIEQINIQNTFSGVYAFRKTRENNEWLYNNLTYPSSWVKTNNYKIPPSEKELNSSLYKYFYSIEFFSEYNLKNDADGSLLIVMFTANEIFSMDMHELIQSKLKLVDWDNLASSFYF